MCAFVSAGRCILARIGGATVDTLWKHSAAIFLHNVGEAVKAAAPEKVKQFTMWFAKSQIQKFSTLYPVSFLTFSCIGMFLYWRLCRRQIADSSSVARAKVNLLKAQAAKVHAETVAIQEKTAKKQLVADEPLATFEFGPLGRPSRKKENIELNVHTFPEPDL